MVSIGIQNSGPQTNRQHDGGDAKPLHTIYNKHWKQAKKATSTGSVQQKRNLLTNTSEARHFCLFTIFQLSWPEELESNQSIFPLCKIVERLQAIDGNHMKKVPTRFPQSYKMPK